LTEEIKSQIYIQLEIELQAEADQLNTLIVGYDKNPETLADELDNYIKNYENNKIAAKLIASLDKDTPASKSFVDAILNLGRDFQSEAQTSTINLIFHVYIEILQLVMKEHEVLKLAMQTKSILTNTSLELTEKYLNTRWDTLNDGFKNSIAGTMQKIKLNDFEVLKDGKVPDNKVVKFKNVIQTFWETMTNLGDVSCDADRYSCTDFDKIQYYSRGCSGEARGCKNLWANHNCLRLTFQDPRVDKMYTDWENFNIVDCGFRIFASNQLQITKVISISKSQLQLMNKFNFRLIFVHFANVPAIKLEAILV
jgi:hypothetical protein